jgi:hypothetical protein
MTSGQALSVTGEWVNRQGSWPLSVFLSGRDEQFFPN